MKSGARDQPRGCPSGLVSVLARSLETLKLLRARRRRWINISTPAELLGSPSLTTGQRGAPVLKGQITNVLPPVTEPAKTVQQRVVMVTEVQSVRWKITQAKPQTSPQTTPPA